MRGGTHVIGTQPIGTAGAIPTSTEQAVTAFTSVTRYGGASVQYSVPDVAAVEGAPYGGAAVKVPNVVPTALVYAFGQDTEVPVVTPSKAETAYVVSKGRWNFDVKLSAPIVATATASGQEAASIKLSAPDVALVTATGQAAGSSLTSLANAASVSTVGLGGAAVQVSISGASVSATAQVHASVDLMLAALATSTLADLNHATAHVSSGAVVYAALFDSAHAASKLSVVYPAIVTAVGLPTQVIGRNLSRNIVVMNTRTFAVSRYSLAALDTVQESGVTYVLSSSGLLAPGEEEIIPVITTGKFNRMAYEINIPKLSFVASGLGNLAVSTVTQERGTTLAYGPYYATLSPVEDVVELGLETRQVARSFQLTFEGQLEKFGELMLDIHEYVRRSA